MEHNAPPRADLQAQTIDRATLERLIEDLTTHAEVHSVLVKHRPGANASPDPIPLREACAQLLRGEARGFQVQYRWEGDAWIDTVLARAGAWRIVRTRLDRPPP